MYPMFNTPQYPTLQPGNMNFVAGTQGFQTAAPLPSMQPAYQRPVIFGRPVNRVEEITANDVPMDGTAGIFPLTDYSALYLKSWNSDGTIKTVKYVPEIVSDCVEVKPTEIDELKSWLEEKFNAVMKSPKTSTKKEVTDND